MYRVGSEEEAIELANATPFGLGSYVFSDDPEQALRVADALDTGMVYVNGVGSTGPSCRSAASSDPGFGRELGRYGIEEFVNKKLIRVGNGAGGSPFPGLPGLRLGSEHV